MKSRHPLYIFGQSLRTISKSFSKALLIFFAISQSAPNYGHSVSIFGEESTEWNYLMLYCDATLNTTYSVEKDSVFNGTDYKYVPGTGLLRETDQNDRLWILNSETGEDILIMDLTLEVGDLFEINGEAYEVDSTFESNGRKIVQFNVSTNTCGNFQMFQFIEGMVPDVGFLFMTSNEDADMFLIRCHTKNETTDYYYEEIYGLDCLYTGSSTEEPSVFGTKMYPMPFDQNITLEFTEAGAKMISIYDMLGGRLMVKNTFSSSVKLDTGHLDSGNYILLIENGKKSESQVIVKH